MRRSGLSIAILVALGAACRPPSPALDLERTTDAERRVRLERVLALVLPEGGADIDLSSGPQLGAWSWPDGRIRVSRSLLDRLDDGELAAAVAHEIGHLLDEGHLRRAPLGLRGGAEGDDLELRADRIACRLLARRGLPVAPMHRLLARLAVDSNAGEAGFARRMAAAEGACGAGPPAP